MAEQFEAYFRRADLDHDGKISGAEAVAFFQGSNLPKPVLAQIWMHADKSRTGYLGREEFNNALKLVTVAQSKRELTPDIVKAALYGPASAKIPPPQINLSAISAPQSNSSSAALAPQMGMAAPAPQMGVAAPAPRMGMGAPAPRMGMGAPAPQMGMGAPGGSQNMGFRGQVPASTGVGSQNMGFRGQVPPSTGMSQQNFPSQNNQSMWPSVPVAAGTAATTSQGIASPNMSTNWLGGRTGGTAVSAAVQTPSSGTGFSMPPAVKPQDPLSISSLTAAKDPKALVGPGNGPGLDSTFGGDMFSANQSLPKQVSPAPSYSGIGTASSSAIVPASAGSQSSAKPDPFEALQSTLSRQSPVSQLQQTQSLPKPNQQVSAQVTSSLSLSGTPAAVGASISEQSQTPWPKMTRTGVQKYVKVFMEVDTDRDGRISGEQARNLFLSWRLPREVLKQVWDLSDQDSDSMLSLREFCIALYLMERYKEGRSLPSTLPTSIMMDETLFSMAGPPTAAYGAVGWVPAPGLRPQQGLPGGQQLTPGNVRPQMPTMLPQADGSMQFNQQNSRGPVESSPADQLSNGQRSMDEKTPETESKAESKENVLLDSKEKLEFYRTKMQDLVLYKSRCDNRLNEITERALADKREAEMLGKKYEEKYKQVAEIASKLTIEEASFREIQERKMELQQAITKMEQGGSADGILQVRADRIQSDLEELLKALAERCKKLGVDLKSTALIELPPGWQPGIPEIAVVWDEEWDKFDDEGFSFDVALPATAKSSSPQIGGSSPTHSYSPDSMSNPDGKSEYTFNKDTRADVAESAYEHSEDESKSPQASPRRDTTSESPTQEYSDNHFRNNFEEDAEAHRSFDEPSWGTFDNNDDIDSVWGFNTKGPDNEKYGEKYFFDSNNSNNSIASPTRSDSPRAESVFEKSSRFAFEDPVPETPLSRAGNSPPRYNAGSGDPFFDSFSRYDSFSTHDRSSSPRRETFTRFDSVNSTGGFDDSRRFSFDDSDPFGSSGPFKVSSESQSPKKGF